MQVSANKVVTIAYTLTDNGGQIIDQSSQDDPLAYLHGAGNIIPGLEQALEGKLAGESLRVSIEPAEAYGNRDEELVQTVPIGLFESPEQVQPGMRFQGQSDEGMRVVTVVDVTEDEVTIDANHPLAGETLNFDVTVVTVREATGDELAHGHAHGEGGHHH